MKTKQCVLYGEVLLLEAETLVQHKARFYKAIGKQNKRKACIRRLVASDNYNKNYLNYNPKNSKY